MTTITPAIEAKHRDSYKCQCSGRICGVNRDHGQIKQDLIVGFVGSSGLTHWEAVALDRKWRSLGKQAAKAGFRGERL